MQKNGYTFATVYNSKCVSVFLHQTIFSTTYQKVGDLFCPVVFLDFRTVWPVLFAKWSNVYHMGTKISIFSKKVKTVHAHWTDSLLQLALACCPAALHTHRLRFYAAAAPRTLCLPASLTWMALVEYLKLWGFMQSSKPRSSCFDN